MTDYQASPALLRTLPRLLSRGDRARVEQFEAGIGTKPVTHAYHQQAVSRAAARVVKTSSRRQTSEERQADIERRRSWAGNNMPPNVRKKYSEAESAALAVIANVCKRKGMCDLCNDEIARLAGVSRTSVQNALRKARSKELCHISVRERPQKGGKNLPNIIKIICGSWINWLARAIGFKPLSTSETVDKNSLSKSADTKKRALERECVADAKQFLMGLPSRLSRLSSVGNPFQTFEQATHAAHGSGGWR